VLALAQRMGLDLATTQGVISQSSGQSWIGSDRMQRALAGDYAPRAHMTLLAKDTALAVQAASQLGPAPHTPLYPGPLGQHAAQVFAQALAAGLAGQDDSALFKLLQTTPVGK
jgi:L-threonate 2-dehydrogenase